MGGHSGSERSYNSPIRQLPGRNSGLSRKLLHGFGPHNAVNPIWGNRQFFPSSDPRLNRCAEPSAPAVAQVRGFRAILKGGAP
jgi:hypothetical protein